MSSRLPEDTMLVLRCALRALLRESDAQLSRHASRMTRARIVHLRRNLSSLREYDPEDEKIMRWMTEALEALKRSKESLTAEDYEVILDVLLECNEHGENSDVTRAIEKVQYVLGICQSQDNSTAREEPPLIDTRIE